MILVFLVLVQPLVVVYINIYMCLESRCKIRYVPYVCVVRGINIDFSFSLITLKAYRIN